MGKFDMTSPEETKPRLGTWLPAVLSVAVSWLVFWIAHGFPTVCNLVDPCPSSDVRVAPALLCGGLMLAPLVAVILMSFSRTPVMWLVRLSYIALVVLAMVGYGAINFSGGLVGDSNFLAGLLGICGTAILAYSGIAAHRRETLAAQLFSSE